MSSPELLVGCPAPDIRLSEIFKGADFPRFLPGKVTVIEFWATWCGPCLETIPHLTTLQKTYPSVTIIGVAVAEQDMEAVKALVRDRGDAMGYTVAMEDPSGWMSSNWCAAAYQAGIPTSFIVDGDGRVAWIGHPADLDEPLAQIVAGCWDIESASAQNLAEVMQGKYREHAALQAEVELCAKASDWSGVVRAYDAAVGAHPDCEPQWGMEKLKFLMDRDVPSAMAYARDLNARFAHEDPYFSFDICGVALPAVRRAVELGTCPPADRHLAELIIEISLDAAPSGEGDEEERAYFSMKRHESLTLALLALGRTDEARPHAEAALDYAERAAGTKVALDNMRDLIRRCAGKTADTPKATPQVVCDGDVCRLI